jgi:tRNA N6-adenosine threonylcarbamoyltransferase
LKTALRLTVERLGGDRAPDGADAADLAASLQEAIIASLVDRSGNAIEIFQDLHPAGRTLVVAGGVAANTGLRRALETLADEAGLDFVAPPPALCTDNGAMIGWAGIERMKLGLTDTLDFAPRPRWPLDPAAVPVRGAGVKA